MNNKGQMVQASLASSLALILTIFITAIVISQVAGVYAPSDTENVSHPVEQNVRDMANTVSPKLLFPILIIVVFVAGVIFLTTSFRAFGG